MVCNMHYHSQYRVQSELNNSTAVAAATTPRLYYILNLYNKSPEINQELHSTWTQEIFSHFHVLKLYCRHFLFLSLNIIIPQATLSIKSHWIPNIQNGFAHFVLWILGKKNSNQNGYFSLSRRNLPELLRRCSALK